MDFNGRLEDVKKVFTTMGPRYRKYDPDTGEETA